jgi:hypothetical protein
MLEIYAGKTALKIIEEYGFKEELFTNFLGASGGPKWFTLFGLDKYLFGEFFKNRLKPLNLIGSSAGAFRAAALCQKNPVEAIKRLAYEYAHTKYSKNPTPNEISANAIDIISTLFGKHGAKEVIENKRFRAHFLVAKCNGLTAFDNKLAQGTGLFSSMLLNKIDRRLLNQQYQRCIFKQPNSELSIDDPYRFQSTYHDLTEGNIKAAVLASGSIPLIMSGVKNIQGSEPGTYRDGGIIDYHFDFSLNKSTPNIEHALTLYPHFTSVPKAGWFDKKSKRKVLKTNYDNTVLLSPSAKFVSSLPYHKIPDRTDFTNMDTTKRIAYWKIVLKETEVLAECFNEIIHKQDISSIKTFQP